MTQSDSSVLIIARVFTDLDVHATYFYQANFKGKLTNNARHIDVLIKLGIRVISNEGN